MRTELASITKAKAWSYIHVESRDHAGSVGIDINIQSSTSKIKSTTRNWNIEMSAKAKNTPGVPFGAELTLGVGQSITRGRTTTTAIGRTFKCAANHYCQVETLTWHVTLVGWCIRLATFNCAPFNDEANAVDICSTARWCEKKNSMRKKWCDGGGLKMERCSVSGVVFTTNRMPLTSVRLTERYSPPFNGPVFSNENMTIESD